MEVHHHSHTSRKKWTHYFWEFIMLFLAVFCGFLAEYQLEHKIEKDREEQYMQSLVRNINEDFIQGDSLRSQNLQSQKICDSLLALLSGKDISNNSYPAYWSRVLNNYEYARFSTYSTDDWLKVPDIIMNRLFPIQTNDANLLNEFANSFENRRRVLDLVMKRVYPAAIRDAWELISSLKEEYHLK